LLAGHAVIGTEGGKALSTITVQRLDAEGRQLSGATRAIQVDCLLMSGGWSPAIHLASQAGAKPEWDARKQAFLPPPATQGWIGAGAFTGSFSTSAAIAEGHAAGAAAADGQAEPFD